MKIVKTGHRNGHMMRWSVLLLALLVAGCTKAAEAPEPVVISETEFVRGRIVDQHINPVGGVNVTWSGGHTMSDQDGLFQVPDVPPAGRLLELSKPSYASISVMAIPGDFINAQMARVLDASITGYVNEYQFNGHLDCSTTAASPCGLLYELAGIGDDTYASLYETESDITHLQTEIVWENTQQFGDTLDVTHRYATREQFEGGTFEGTLVRGVGESPLLIVTDEKKYNREGVGKDYEFMVVVFAGATDDTPLFGVAASQDYELFVHEFHGYEPSKGWRFTSQTPP